MQLANKFVARFTPMDIYGEEMGTCMQSYLLALLIGFNCLYGQMADLIFFNGEIITVNETQPTAEAVVVANGKILFVGDLSVTEEFRSPQTQKIDLKGKTLLPGFIDPHTHLLYKGFTEKAVDVTPFKNKTISQVLDVLKRAAAKGPVLAFGYDPSLMDKPSPLGFEELDRISTTVPILVVNLSGHIAYGNRKVFEQAGIRKDTPNPPGGYYEKNAKGELTGVAYELLPISTLVASYKEQLKLDYPQIALHTAKEYARNGFTTITDLGLGMDMPSSSEHIQIMKNLSEDPNAPLRIQGYVVFPLLNQIPQLKTKNNPRFQILGVKIWADGSTQGYTAALRKPYKGKTTSGKMNFSQEELNAMVLKAHQMGLQIAIHANGDRAVESALEAYEGALKALPHPDPRFRIEHATVTDEPLMQRMARAQATPSFTNQHIYFWGEAFKETILGEPRADHIDAARTAKKFGMKYSFHDDAPLASINPLLMMEIAVTRNMADGKILNAEETVSIDEAIKALTLYPAWQSRREKELGSIEVGKYADFVILDQNPKTVPFETLTQIQVVETWIEGKKVNAVD
jgi:predicted amidohydrolase YtcJ